MTVNQQAGRTIIGILGLLLFIFAAGDVLLRLIVALIGLALFFYGFGWRKQEAYYFIQKQWYHYKKR